MKWARVLLPLTTLGVAACGALLGIETDLSIPPEAGAVNAFEAGEDAAGASTADSGVDIDPEAGSRRPPAGTYVYRATGGDYLGAFGGQSTTYPPTLLAEIAYEGPACFSMTLPFRPGYTEVFHFCIRGKDIALESETHMQSFQGAATNTQYDCMNTQAVFFTTAETPAGKRTYDCFGNKIENAPDENNAFHVSGTYSFDGGSTQAVGSDIFALRLFYDDVRVLKKADSNQQYGDAQTHWHFKADDGVLVHFERTVDSTYMYAMFVHYKEHVVLDLQDWPGTSDGGKDAAPDSD